MAEQNLILSGLQVRQKINRLTYQVLEEHYGEEQVLIAGIARRGYKLAERVHQKLEELSKMEARLLKVTLDKENPLQKPVQIMPDTELKDQVVVLVDDVLYTGRTLAYAAQPFLQAGVKKLQVLVLVNRGHNHFPIQPHFVGLHLATTLQEHVNVELEQDQPGVYLS